MNKVPFLRKRKMLLLHGPGIVNSRSKLNLIKKSFSINNVVLLEGQNCFQEIAGTLLTPLLFSEPRLVILENPDEKMNFETINTQDPNTTFLIWADHEITVTSPLLQDIKRFEGEIFFFNSSREISVFPFLDNLAFKETSAFLQLQKLNTSGLDVHYILTMVFYLLRNLVTTPKKAPEFVRVKLAKQRVNFTPENIRQLYKSILEIEFRLKSGLLDEFQAEFSLVTKFVGS